MRYNSDGVLDNTFDSDGIVSTDIPGGNGELGYAIAIQADGKILVVGSASNTITLADFCVVRYNSDGSLDNTFDADGIVTTDVGADDDIAFSVAIQNDGKIVVAGESRNGSFDFAVCRYNTNGSLDTTFSADGKLTTAMGSGNDAGRSVKIQNDGKILVGGEGYFSGSGFDFALARYNTDGTLDNSFSGDGKVFTGFGNFYEGGASVLIQADGKIVVAGSSNTVFALVRYNANGSLDNTFDTDGRLTTIIGSSANGRSALLQNDGKIVVAGGSSDGTDNDFALARYNPDGSLDNSFDSDGKLITDIDGLYDYCYAVALQPDGKILAAGYNLDLVDSTNDFIVARYYDGYIGIEESAGTEEVNIYPNPTGGMVSLNTVYYSGQPYSVLNGSGQILATGLINGNQLDLSSLLPGVYYLNIGESHKVFLRVVKN